MGVALRVVERHHHAGAVDRVHTRLTGQLGGPPEHRRQCGIRRRNVCRLDLFGQRVPLGIQPVHRRLGVADEIDEPRRVAAANLRTAGNPVRRGQQQAGEQAHQRNAETPRRAALIGHHVSVSWSRGQLG
ncbi:hypothetical protein NIIDMKKI_76350 [Mycobacterium kansasii]|uniref:Uncharacterized protein n=1 Tax=Mycobacterium kansasii TaxID=1768 RepID=A0A7G1IR50_MYCKA|nr:hypothetical protein NIIDMKKI_76350 [Mycobacterium kansasii]